MDKVVVRESLGSNLFWAIASAIAGGVFAYAMTDLLFGWLLPGLFLAGSILFAIAALRRSTILTVDDSGIWTGALKRKIAWNEIRQISVEGGLFIVELRDVESAPSEASWLTNALSKRSVIDISRADREIVRALSLIQSKMEN